MLDRFLDAIDSLGFILNPVVTVVPGSSLTQEVLDGCGKSVAHIIQNNPPTIIGDFPKDTQERLISAGFIVENPTA